MQFHYIHGTNSLVFKEIWQIYEESFPPDERRTLAQQEELFNRKNYVLLAVYKENKLVGFISNWVLDSFCFVEHAAIKKSHQGKGFGTKSLALYLKKVNKTFILEVELPTSQIARKRIDFYKKLGFKLNDFDYVQPSYSKSKKSVHLMIMSYPKELKGDEFEEIKKEIYKKIYGI
ncbi:MAG: GNAT family N-acetyltransferase [Candidatus Micrarchaeota archaeon]